MFCMTSSYRIQSIILSNFMLEFVNNILQLLNAHVNSSINALKFTVEIF